MNALITPIVHTPDAVDLDIHHCTRDLSDRVAYGITRGLRLLADAFFAKRYGNRAIVLETVAAVPGLVGAALVHLRCLRWMSDDEGWIRTLMEEAENERMHLMTFIEIARPNWLERALVLLAQAAFFTFFLLLYIVSARTAHRLVGYFEEQGLIVVHSDVAGRRIVAFPDIGCETAPGAADAADPGATPQAAE